MLRGLRITGFRALREFAMSGLGRVNLLVGTNNCGKTSVLEAIHMLSAPGSAAPLWLAQARRGELVDNAIDKQVDVAHLVHGHKIAKGSAFRVVGDGATDQQVLVAEFVSRKSESRGADEDDGEGRDGDDERDLGAAAGLLAPLSLRLNWSGVTAQKSVVLKISRQAGLSLARVLSSENAGGSEQLDSLVLITTEGLTRNEITSMFERVVLTPNEESVVRALRTIEPGIERIASVGTHTRQSTPELRGGLAMMVAGQRIHIGSMGDGIWRLLGIALALVQARGGVLLVDEIDTGLHYSVLVDMWRLVLATARNLDVQVFATTHSRDCYEALAAVTEPDRSEISLQRIERGKTEAVAFSEAELQQAAERGLEVR
jgi:ABC-type branched-subunit amino acid transport system ATPase component